MKFEKQFGERLKQTLINELQQITGKERVEVILSSNNQYQPLESDSNAVSVVVKTGNATKSHVPGYDMNTLPLTVNFAVEEHGLNVLLEAMTAISDRDNATFGDIEINGAYTKYKVIFNTPYVVGGPQSLHTKTATIKAVNVVWFMNLTYSTNAILKPPEFKFIVGSETYPMDFLLRFDTAIQPVYDGAQVSGVEILKNYLMSVSYAYNFVVYQPEKGVSAFVDMLVDNERGINSLFEKELSLQIEDDVVKLTTYSLSRIFENDIAAINLSVGR